MFTGIIRDMGTVRTAHRSGGGMRLSLSTAFALDPSDIGASIACAGCCLTVVAVENDAFSVDVSAETLSKTTLGGWGPGTRVNLERSLRVGDEMGGHMVSGHVDGLAILDTVRPDGGCWRLDFSVPEALSCFLAPKGSVALDGVSLTVNEVKGNRFGVAIIPHTWTHTTLGGSAPGARLNLEVDLMARYAARILGLRQTGETPE